MACVDAGVALQAHVDFRAAGRVSSSCGAATRCRYFAGSAEGQYRDAPAVLREGGEAIRGSAEPGARGRMERTRSAGGEDQAEDCVLKEAGGALATARCENDADAWTAAPLSALRSGSR